MMHYIKYKNITLPFFVASNLKNSKKKVKQCRPNLKRKTPSQQPECDEITQLLLKKEQEMIERNQIPAILSVDTKCS